MTLSKRQRYQQLWGQLEAERSSFLPHWRELNDYILPRRGRFTLTDANRGNRRSTNIIDSTATQAARTLSSGMMSGLTSPARPWFRLTVPDPVTAELASVKTWLHDVTMLMQTVFLRSNIYNALPLLYQDMGVFGTASMLVEEDPEDVIRCRVFPIGSYAISNDERGRVRVFMRQFRMTVRQIVEKFGGDQRNIDWSNISAPVKNHWDRKNFEQWVDVTHVVAPNDEYDSSRLRAKYKPFVDCYYETGSVGDKFLMESGYDEFPVLAPRWHVTGEDVYATDCPGMTALGDIKQLQFGEKKRMKAIDKILDPPLIGPAGLANVKVSLLPADITYWNERSGGMEGLRPIHEVKPELYQLLNSQEECRHRVRRAFFEDLFLMLGSNPALDRGQRTAREIEERHEEKFLAVGPVLEQLNQELLHPLIDRVFAIMVRREIIPPAPEEIQDTALKVEYISVMAQAQKRIGLAGINEFAGFVGSVMQMDPSVLDKVDRDQLIDEYAEMTGIPPRIVVPDEDVFATRAERAQSQQAAAQAEQALQVSQTAKNLAQAPTEGRNALADVVAAGGGAGIV